MSFSSSTVGAINSASQDERLSRSSGSAMSDVIQRGASGPDFMGPLSLALELTGELPSLDDVPEAPVNNPSQGRSLVVQKKKSLSWAGCVFGFSAGVMIGTGALLMSTGPVGIAVGICLVLIFATTMSAKFQELKGLKREFMTASMILGIACAVIGFYLLPIVCAGIGLAVLGARTVGGMILLFDFGLFALSKLQYDKKQ